MIIYAPTILSVHVAIAPSSFSYLILHAFAGTTCTLYNTYIGIGAGPAGQVLAGTLLSKVKMKLHFCKKQAMNRSASMIFRLVRLICISYSTTDRKRISRDVSLSATHTQNLLL